VGDARLNRLWAVVCVCAGVFLLMWPLSSIKANILKEDLQNRCDVHTSSFPFEKSCTREDGTVEGANSSLFNGIFYGSMTAAAVSLTAALALDARERKKPRGASAA
jgi:ABC-type Fe3+ transport system permease subunit